MIRNPRVLMFSYYFPPMGGVEVQRVTRFARLLSAYDWQSVVVTTRGAGHTGKDESLLESLPEDLIVERTLAVEHPSTLLKRRLMRGGVSRWQAFRRSRKLTDRLLRRLYKLDRRHCFPDPMNWWAWYAGLHVNRLCEKYKPDILWATGYPWSVLRLLADAGEKTGIPTVGDIRDPWSWHPQGFWQGERHRRCERSTLSQLTHVVTVTEGFKQKYVDLYPELEGRMSVIRNCFEDGNRSIAKTEFSPRLFCYIGSLTTGDLKDLHRRTLDTFLQALSLCLKRNMSGAAKTQVHVAGRGVEKTQLIVDEYGVSDIVSIVGNLSYDAANDLRASADVLIMVMGIGDEAETFVPLKLYEYLAANRPILALLPEGSEAGQIILEKERGVVCRIDDVEDIARGIERIVTGKLPYDPDSDVSEYSCEASTEKLASLFDRITSQSSD